MHQRAAIRKALLAILKAANTAAGQNVYSNHTLPQWHEDLTESPAILVYSLDEDAEEYAQAPRTLDRSLFIAIEIMATAVEDEPEDETLQDILDDLCLEVEDALSIDDTITGTAEDFILRSTSINLSNEAEKPIGSAKLTYKATYLTDVPRSIEDQTEQVSLGNLEGANTEWDIGHNDSEPDEVIDAEDQIDVEQIEEE